METRNYVLLLSLNAQNAAAGKLTFAHLLSRIDHDARLLWIDSGHAGFVLTSGLPGVDVWRKLLADPHDLENFNDALILEIGHDWSTRGETKHAKWLATHVGPPRPSVLRR